MRMGRHSFTGRRSTWNREVGIVPRSTGNRFKRIPRKQVTVSHDIIIPGHCIMGIPGHCTIIIPGHCLFWLHTMRLVGIGIVYPVETALM